MSVPAFLGWSSVEELRATRAGSMGRAQKSSDLYSPT
jgi:hypothetical protein